MSDQLHASEVDLGAVVWLVEDTDDGPSRSAMCERMEVDGRACFGGFDLGDERRSAIDVPDDGRRIEWFKRDPGFRTAPDSWLYGRWLVLDTETTGLEEPRNIVELGAVIMQEGAVLEHRSALFNPGKPIDEGASAVHGITNDMVARKPRISDPNPRTGMRPVDSLDRMAARWNVQAIVGYNLIAFDLPILRRELGDRFCGIEAAIGCVVDPLVIVRLDQVGKFWRGTGRHKLTSVAERLELLEPEHGMFIQAHRASWDCVLAGRVLWHLRDHLPTDAAEAHALCGSKGAEQRAELDAYWAKQPPKAAGAAR